MRPRLTFAEMYCGVGGFRYGLEQVGKDSPEVGDTFRGRDKSRGSDATDNQVGQFRCVWANELDKYACRVYRSRWNDGTLREGDIRAVDPASVPDHDILCAGFPCQPFSNAGKRQGFDDTRGTLFFEICRIARAKRPRYLWLENVNGLLSNDGGETFLTILRSLDELGYDCQWQVFNSRYFGVPQNRERVFIIGHLRGTPRPQVFPFGEDDGLPGEDGGEMLPCLTSSDYKGPSKQSSIPIVAMTAYRAGNRLVSRVQETETYPALDGSVGYAVNFRRLTPLECERLQAFPDRWTEKGLTEQGKVVPISDTQRYKMLGNAVTTSVITAIGRAFLAACAQRGVG